MPENAIEKFDSLVAALVGFLTLHEADSPEYTAAIAALGHVPSLREQIKASVPRMTDAEILVVEKEIAGKLRDSIVKLRRLDRCMDVADVTDIYWPYLVQLIGKPR